MAVRAADAVNPVRRRALVPGLDGLRALAIGMVILRHALPEAFPGGFVGVDLFFVLSGFLITSLLLAEHDAHGRLDLGRFYLRRLLRLAPALMFLVLVLAAVGWFWLPPAPRDALLLDLLLAVTYTTNWARAFDWHAVSLTGHTWSLAIEEQFYLLWPVLLTPCLGGLARQPKRILWCLGLGWLASWLSLCALWWDGATVDRLLNGLDTRAHGLLAGAWLAVALDTPGLGPRLAAFSQCWGQWLLATCLAGLLTCLLTTDEHATGWLVAGPVWMDLCGVAMILALLWPRATGLVSWMAHPRLVHVGHLSYALYLWHYPITVVLHTKAWPAAAAGALGAAATWLMASLSHRWIEQPFLRWKARLTPTREDSPTRPVLP